MRKYFLTSLMSLFLMIGTGAFLSATETQDKAKSSCCSSTAQATETAEAKSSCDSSKADKADAACCSSKGDKASNADAAQASSSKVAGCAGASAAAGCAGTATVNGRKSPMPGECTKVPSGLRSQRTE